MRIAISPDENPGDPGTTADPAITERDLNVKVATALEAALQRCGQDAWFDHSITFEERVNKANADGTRALVACAHNAGGGEGTVFVFCDGGHEAQTPRWSDGSANQQDRLAQRIGVHLVGDGVSPRWTTFDENVFESCDFQFDTAYIEYLFMDNAGDQARLASPDYPQRAAEATVKGLADVFGFAYVAPGSSPAPVDPPVPTPTSAPISPELAALNLLWQAANLPPDSGWYGGASPGNPGGPGFPGPADSWSWSWRSWYRKAHPELALAADPQHGPSPDMAGGPEGPGFSWQWRYD